MKKRASGLTFGMKLGFTELIGVRFGTQLNAISCNLNRVPQIQIQADFTETSSTYLRATTHSERHLMKDGVFKNLGIRTALIYCATRTFEEITSFTNRQLTHFGIQSSRGMLLMW